MAEQYTPAGRANRANWRGVRFLICPDCGKRGVYWRGGALWWCRICRWDADTARLWSVNPDDALGTGRGDDRSAGAHEGER